MDNETKGRLLALEALVKELVIALPFDQATGILGNVLPPLQRQPQELGGHATELIRQISLQVHEKQRRAQSG
ncbi:hypothetical protein [Pseudoxanthomonas dokdonensis]|uniref:hypothetical protein n=1 Tax=Pseudoxanthomonas dokdonensis TaxID=344882 RepID=UPI000AD0E47A|nr:hypothetical protein [Pseudoxanthomonas dokdonensis]